jgi:predicted metalloprotease with PDZ domain
VFPGSPADKAALGPGMMITNVNGARFSAAAMRDALKRAKSGTAPIQLAATNNSEHANYSLDYHGGERYPALERVASKPDVLTQIISPTTNMAVKK